MSKEKIKKITLANLMERSQQSELDKMRIKEIPSDILGGSIVATKIPMSDFLDITDVLESTSGTRSATEVAINLIYDCCTMLQDTKLHEAYKAEEPTDIVAKIFNDNVGEINRIGLEIMQMYGMASGNVSKELKN